MEQRRKQRIGNTSERRIRVDAKNSVVRAFVGGLNVEEITETIESANAEALKLLDEQASRRRHRPPYTLRHLDANRRTIWEIRGRSRVYDEGNVADWAANVSPIDVYYLEGEDGGGEKVSVRVEVEGVRKN